MPTLRTMTFRVFLYSNGCAYDIESTIDVLRTRDASPAVSECIQSLRRMQYGPRIENFMPSLGAPNANLLIPLEHWLHRFAVQVVGSLGDSSTIESIDIDDDETRSVDTLISEMESFDDVIVETHANYYGNRNINADVVAGFMNLRYGRPTTVYSSRVDPTDERDDEFIEDN